MAGTSKRSLSSFICPRNLFPLWAILTALIHLSGNSFPSAVITLQPQSKIVRSGSDVVFSTETSAPNPCEYQWMHDGTVLANETNSLLILRNVQPADQGRYSVRLTSVSQSIESDPATLTVCWQVQQTSVINQPDFPASSLGNTDAGGNIYQTRALTRIDTDPRNPIPIGVGCTKMTPSGNVLWDVQYIETNQPLFTVSYHDALPRGGYVISGMARPGYNSPTADVVILHISAQGVLDWSYRFQSEGDSHPLQVDSADNIYVAARLPPDSPLDENAWRTNAFSLVKLDRSGKLQWATRQPGATGISGPSSLRIDGDDHLCVSGFDSAFDYTYVVAKLDSLGHQLWLTERPPLFDSSAPRISAVDNSGNIFLSGYVNWSSSFPSPYILKYDADGNERWILYPGGYWIPAQTVDRDGNLYLAISATDTFFGEDNQRIAIAKFDENANRLWNSDSFQFDGFFSTIRFTVDSEQIRITGSIWRSSGTHNWLSVEYIQNTVPGLPIIRTLPPGGRYLIGQDIILAVSASGPELSYQWLLNSGPIPGATNSTLLLPGMQQSPLGSFAVLVTNRFGCALSDEIGVTVVNVAPFQLQPPTRTFFSDCETCSTNYYWKVDAGSGTDPNRTYRFESSTNLIDWQDEPYLSSPNPPFFSSLWVPEEKQKFFRMKTYP